MLSQPAGDGTPPADIAALLSSGDDPNRNTLRASTLVSELMPLPEVIFVEAPNLPDALVAVVEVAEDTYFVGYRSDIYDRANAAVIARIVLGRDFVDVTDEVTR